MATTKSNQAGNITTAAARGRSPDEPVVVPVTSRRQKLKRTLLSIATTSSLPEILLIASLAMARYIKNSDFSYPSEIIIDIVLLGTVVSALFYLIKWVVRGRLIAAHFAGGAWCAAYRNHKRRPQAATRFAGQAARFDAQSPDEH